MKEAVRNIAMLVLKKGNGLDDLAWDTIREVLPAPKEGEAKYTLGEISDAWHNSQHYGWEGMKEELRSLNRGKGEGKDCGVCHWIAVYGNYGNPVCRLCSRFKGQRPDNYRKNKEA